MPACVLFVSHTGAMSGAEYVLANLTNGWANGRALLFEDGLLADALRRNGLDVRTLPAGGGLKTFRRGGSVLRALPLAGSLLKLVGTIAHHGRSSDVIYANSQKAFLLSALANIVLRKPLVWHLHDVLDARHFGLAQRRIQTALANRFGSRVLVPSQAAANAFVASGGRRDLVTIVPNGVTLPAFSINREDYRRDQGLPRGSLIGVFSRLAEWKGQHVVLEALRILPDVRCIIVGSALFGEEQYELRLQRLVEEYGLQDRVLFLGQRSDVDRLMVAVDVVVHPSVDPEPFGLTLVEAMLARTPVVATNAGASGEILEGGVAGKLVAPGSAQEMAEAIVSILTDTAARDAMIAHARRRAEKFYDIETMRKAVKAAVLHVATGRAA